MIFIIIEECAFLYFNLRNMKTILTSFLIILSFSSFGWGQLGHRIVGEVAWRHMTPEARENVLRVLGGESPAMASNWMDFIKSDHHWDHMRSWHYVTIPDSVDYQETETPEHGDAYLTVQRIVEEMESGEFEGWTEDEALKALIHLVGDLHQPLHVGNGTDRGGNDVKVKWFGKDSNLHRVWDSEMIDSQQLSYTEYTEWIDNATEEEVLSWQSDSATVWMQECKDMRESVYDIENPDRLGYRYNYDHIEEVNEQLLKAGIRLAGILNDLYGE